MIKLLRILSFSLLAFSFAARAEVSPVGTWQTIDDETGQPKSIVELSLKDGELTGVIQELIGEPNGGAAKTCEECKGENKDKPIVGLEFVWGLEKDDDVWSGGKILDPKNGKVYKCKITPSADGKTLDVRGFIGFALIGRTQTWNRVQ